MTFYKKRRHECLEVSRKGFVMPRPMQEGTNIYVEQKRMEANFAMPIMEMAKDYYEVGYIISGDRKTITPTATYRCGAGSVGFTPPFVYHRTMPTSNEPYERVLIKFTQNFINPFIQTVGQNVLDQLYEQKICCFSEDATKRVEHMFLEIVEEYEKNSPYREFILQGMLFRLLLTIYEERLPDSDITPNREPLTPPVMDAIAFIENDFANSPTLEEAAQVAGFSPAYFSRLFSAQMGKSYSEYLDNVKIRHVQILLTGTKKTIMEIAEETGYCHGNYLNSQFKKKVGMTPGQYRKQHKGE